MNGEKNKRVREGNKEGERVETERESAVKI